MTLKQVGRMVVVVLAAGVLRHAQGDTTPVCARGMVILPDGDVLVWWSGGGFQVQRRNGTGYLNGHLPLTYVVDAVADGDGALFAGSRGASGQEEQALVVKIRADGTPSGEWALGAGVAGSIAVVRDLRLAVGHQGVVELQENGRVSYFAPASGLSEIELSASGVLICTPADRTLAGQSPPSCRLVRDNQQIWSSTGRWSRPPLICGTWVLEPGDSQVEVRSISDGVVQGTFPIEARAPLACARPDAALAGGSTTRLVRLPDGEVELHETCHGEPSALLAVDTGRAFCATPAGVVHPMSLEP